MMLRNLNQNIDFVKKSLKIVFLFVILFGIGILRNKVFAWDQTCIDYGLVGCLDSPPPCHTNDKCWHEVYNAGEVCNPGMRRYYKFVCPLDCWGGDCGGTYDPTDPPPSGGDQGECKCGLPPDGFCVPIGSTCGENAKGCGIGVWPCYAQNCLYLYCDPEDNDPKGAFDGSSCNSKGVISGWGWTCDGDDYDTRLNVKIYNGDASDENLITTVIADKYRGEGSFEGVCGGDRYHGFEFSSGSITFSPGTYTIKAYGINIGGGDNTHLPSDKIVTCPSCPKVNGGLSDWGACSAACEKYGTQQATCTDPAPSCGGSDCSAECTAAGGNYVEVAGLCEKTCYGGPCCYPNPGTLSAWSQCSGGKQTRTCDGATCCPVGCIQGTLGCNCGNCNGDVLERNCLYVEGMIWSDDNLNGQAPSDNWWNPNYSVVCRTSKSHPSFYLTYTNHTDSNQINEWYCNGSNSYYRSPFNGPVENIEPEQPHSFTLSSWPDGYKPKEWHFRSLVDPTGIKGSWVSGPFSTSSIIMPSQGWTNVHWELQQEKYNLEIIVKKIKPEIIDLPDQCTDGGIYDGSLENASITVYDADDVSQVVCSGSSNSEGKLTCPIWILQGPLKIEARKDVLGLTPETFTLKCPNDTSYEYNPGLVSEGDSKTADIGLQTSYKNGWVSAIDSDIFANLLSVVVPAGPTDNNDSGQTPQGFAKTLINSSGNTDRFLGFAFSHAGEISNSPNNSEKIFETISNVSLGGNAYNLLGGMLGTNKEHFSKWLKNFTFTPPSGADELETLSGTFESGKVYKVDREIFNNKLKEELYYTVGDGISILYINGDIYIPNPITTSSVGRILLVVNGSVEISENVGTDVASFNMSINPNIMAGIIARGGVEIESQGTASESTFDKPIMFTAPLISKTGLTFSRDLYHNNNATMPAESAKAFNKYLYLLTSLERQKSQDNLYFTGVTTFDLDWEYIY